MTTTAYDISHQIDLKGNSLAVGEVVTSATLGGLVSATNVTSYWTGNAVPSLLATAGNDTACSNGDRYWMEVTIPSKTVVTGIQYLIGSVGGTDKVIVELHNDAGTLLATSALAGVTVGTAANVQAVPFTAAYNAAGPGRYFIVVQFNGTTAKFRTHTTPGLSMIAGTVAGTFGTSAAITPGTTYTANKGPVAGTY